MTGKLLAGFIVVVGIGAGILMYYLQVYAYYDEIPSDAAVVELTMLDNTREQIVVRDFEGIDSTSSPLRYRACFEPVNSLAMLTETFPIYEKAVPLNAPDWFDCFNAQEIGAALENGTAIAFLGVFNFEYGFDRVVAVTEDGRGFAWQQLNDCGEAYFNSDPLPNHCPLPPEEMN